MTITVMTCERWGGDLHMIGSCAVVLISSRYTVVCRAFILNDKSIPARDAFICSEAVLFPQKSAGAKDLAVSC